MSGSMSVLMHRNSSKITSGQLHDAVPSGTCVSVDREDDHAASWQRTRTSVKTSGSTWLSGYAASATSESMAYPAGRVAARICRAWTSGTFAIHNLPFAHGRCVTWEGFRTRAEALLWSTCSKLLRRSQPLNVLTLEKGLANSLGLNIDDSNQRIKVHEHLRNLVLQFLQQHHQELSCPILRKMRRCRRTTTSNVHTSCSQRSSPPFTITSQKDDAELVTPPAVNHSQSSTAISSLPTVSAAALAGKSFDVPAQQQLSNSVGLSNLFTACQPRLPSKQHPRCSPCTARLKTSSSTTPGPVSSRDSTSSRPPLLLPCRR